MSSAGGDGDLGDAGGSDDGGDWGESNNGFADMDWDVASALDASSATHLVGETEAHFHDIDNILASEVGTYVFLDPTESNDGRHFYGDEHDNPHGSDIVIKEMSTPANPRSAPRGVGRKTTALAFGDSPAEGSDSIVSFINIESTHQPFSAAPQRAGGESHLAALRKDIRQHIHVLRQRADDDKSMDSLVPRQGYRTYGTMSLGATESSPKRFILDDALVKCDVCCALSKAECDDLYYPCICCLFCSGLCILGSVPHIFLLLPPLPLAACCCRLCYTQSSIIPYVPLPGPSYIRLIVLYPDLAHDSIPHFSLEVVDLNSLDIGYEAVSYCWGNRETRPSPVFLSGFLMYIDDNLKRLLLRLRLQNRRRVLWIDGLCIDQANLDERQQQVGMMQRIYAQAARVLIMLSYVNNANSQRWVESVQYIATTWFRFHESVPDPTSEHQPRASIFHAIVDRSEFDMEAIREMFSNELWTRLWIVQEVASSTRAVVDWAGGCIPWTLVGLVATLIRNNTFLWKMYTSPGHGLRSSPEQKRRCRRAIIGLMNAYFMYRLPSSNFRSSSLCFLNLLLLTRRFNVTEPLDRIYAILGLPSQHTGPERSFIIPNYKLSQEDLYIRVFLQVFNTHESPLRILSAVRHTALPRANFATWVPQWHVPPIRSISGTHRPDETFNASAGGPPDPMLSVTWEQNMRTLTLQGLIIGVVSYSESVIPNSSDDRKNHGLRITSWLDAFASRGDNHVKRLGLTLTAGQDWYGALVQGAAQERHGRCFTRWARGQLWDAEVLRDAPPDNPDEDPAQYDQAVRNVCRGRKLFAASRCGYGLGPDILQPCDVICVLLGGPVPYILRPLGGEMYNFLGECYVSGYMFGEAMADRPHSDLGFDKFVLQ